jgi:predicted ArsR family transcriptional regulator
VPIDENIGGMAESGDLMTRIDRLCSRASDARPTGPLLRDMEDTLAEGYVEALAGEARSRRLAERLEALVETLDQEGAAVEIARIVPEKRKLDAQVAVLRGRLALLRERFEQLRAGSRPG